MIPLPPYAPELNAMEQVWKWIKNHFLSNQCYGVYEDIVTMACYAWNQLSKDVELVKSIMYIPNINHFAHSVTRKLSVIRLTNISNIRGIELSKNSNIALLKS